MRLRLLALCLGLVAVPALAGMTADARACSRHASRNAELSWAAADRSLASPGMRFSVGAAYPL